MNSADFPQILLLLYFCFKLKAVLKNDISLCKHSINLVGLVFLLTVSDVGFVVIVGFFFFFPLGNRAVFHSLGC